MNHAACRCRPSSVPPDIARILRLIRSFVLGVLPVASAIAAGQPAPVPLFNGTNLDGWSTWLVDTKHRDPRHVFSVTNGMIRLSGDGLGYLASSNAFRDYLLSLEFKWGARNTHWGDRLGKARDSGVFLHATGPDGNSHDGNGAFMAAIECNLFQGATGDFLLIRGNDAQHKLIAPRVTIEARAERDRDGWPWSQPGGKRITIERWGRVNWINKSAEWRDETDFRGAHDVEKPTGEWNRLEIRCDGGRIVVMLNGSTVNEAFAVWPRAGKILLQCEGSEIFFRRVAVLPLNSARE